MYKETDHTWCICAYGKSQYIEDAVKSVLHQSKKSNIIMVTSTPNNYLRNIAEKYRISLYINEGDSGIANDWNFAYQMAKTELLTLCHQDDIYSREYVERILEYLNQKKHPLIVFTSYGEIRNGKKFSKNKLLRIKRILSYPLRFSSLQQSRWIRRRCLSLGNCICCPSVTYVKKNLPERIFFQKYKSNVDWYTWEKLSKQKGSFVYIPHILMHHRIHMESTTTEIIGENLRTKEDYEMFCKFWPKWIAKGITKAYQFSEESNNV